MCVVSNIGDAWGRTAPDRWPTIFPTPYVPGTATGIQPPPTRAEFDALKAEIEALKDLLLAAKEYDERTGQPDCETDDKVALIKAVAEAVGVDLDEVLGSD